MVIIQLALAQKLVKGNRVLQAGDVLLDVGVSPHGRIELGRGPGGVGVEAPVAELEARKEAALGTGVQRLSPDDEPGASRQLVILDQRRQLAHRRAVAQRPVLAEYGLPDGFEPVEDGRGDLGIRARSDEEGDVSRRAGGKDPLRAAGRVGSHEDRAHDCLCCIAGPMSTAIPSGSWATAQSSTATWSATVLAPALPDRSSPASVSPVASAKQNIGWKPNPPLKVAAASSLCSPCARSGPRPRRRRCRGRPGRCPCRRRHPRRLGGAGLLASGQVPAATPPGSSPRTASSSTSRPAPSPARPDGGSPSTPPATVADGPRSRSTARTVRCAAPAPRRVRVARSASIPTKRCCSKPGPNKRTRDGSSATGPTDPSSNARSPTSSARAWGGRRARTRGTQRIGTDLDTRAGALNSARLAALGLHRDRSGWAMAPM